jgi:hypothetical protein
VKTGPVAQKAGKRAPASNNLDSPGATPAQADAPGGEVVAIVAVVTTEDAPAPDEQEAPPTRRAPDNLA